MVRLLIGVATASLVCFLIGPVAAQDVPSFAQPLGDASLSGTVVRFAPGNYDLGLLDDRGFIDRIVLHPGTIIMPVGIDLATGMRVSVIGRSGGAVFFANQIDRDDRRFQPAWYDRWVAPHTETAQNPPVPPIISTPFP